MTDKKKFEVLRKEIDSYKQRLNAAEKENKRLSDRLAKADETEEVRSLFHENAAQEYEKIKKEYNSCINELCDYKKRYLDLLKEMADLKQHYQNEFTSFMKITNKKTK